MVICKECGKDINHLRQVRTGVEECDIFFNKKEGYLDWGNEEFNGDGIVIIYSCPECNEELDFDDEQAEKFLKEKDVLKEIVAEKLKKDKN